MRNLKWIISLELVIISLLIICGCANSPASIRGTWTVKEYKILDNTISSDDIYECLDNDELTLNEFKLVFYPNERCEVITSSLNEECIYKISDEVITIYFESDTENVWMTALYDGENIALAVSDDIHIIFENNNK